MRKEAFSIIFTGQTSREAEALAKELREIGLHPADLGLTAPLAAPGSKATFPVEVPWSESEKAREFLDRRRPVTVPG